MKCPVCGEEYDIEDMVYNEYLQELQCRACCCEYYDGIQEAYVDMTGDNDYPWGNEW